MTQPQIPGVEPASELFHPFVGQDVPRLLETRAADALCLQAGGQPVGRVVGRRRSVDAARDRLSRPDPDQLRPLRQHHAEFAVCGLLDACMLGPGALFDLQLAPFDVQFIALVRELLELDKQLA